MTSISHQGLAVEYLPVESLRVQSAQRQDAHSRRQISQIAASIREFGFINPILVDQESIIIAGHGRAAGAKSLGLTTVPVIRLEGLTPDQIRAYVIADNALAEKAGWDKSILAIELQHLLSIDDIEVTITGFEMGEIDLIR